VLHSLINKLTIFLHPEFISVVKQTGLFNKRVSSKDTIVLNYVSGQYEYLGLIDALVALLSKPEWKGYQAEIVLSGEFTKFRVVKWSDDLSCDEREVLAKHQLEEIYGIEGKSLRVFVSDSGFRNNSLAFALDDDFFNALLNIEKQGIVSIRSIVPYFSKVIDCWRNSISKSAWLVIRDNALVYYAKIKDDSWEAIKVFPAKAGWELGVENIIDREMVHFPDEEVGQIYFHDAGSSPVNLEAIMQINKTVKVLGRDKANEPDDRLLFTNYLS
jgi:hypothetical protein